MRIILVLDILDRIAVHASGERERKDYPPVGSFSRIIDSSDPVEIVEEIRPKEVYIADINRLLGKNSPNEGMIKRISKRCKTLLDFGCRSMKDVLKAGKIADKIVLGTETASLELIEEAQKKIKDAVVSIDMKNGKVISDGSMPENPFHLLQILNDFEISEIILLNMESIGSMKGVNHSFVRKASELSEHPLIIGGGVTKRDVDVLLVEGFLVSTGIHDRSIPLELLR